MEEDCSAWGPWLCAQHGQADRPTRVPPVSLRRRRPPPRSRRRSVWPRRTTRCTVRAGLGRGIGSRGKTGQMRRTLSSYRVRRRNPTAYCVGVPPRRRRETAGAVSVVISPPSGTVPPPGVSSAQGVRASRRGESTDAPWGDEDGRSGAHTGGRARAVSDSALGGPRVRTRRDIRRVCHRRPGDGDGWPAAALPERHRVERRREEAGSRPPRQVLQA